ncbi:helix-turn-helix transcriptional regulator [Clostridium tertium]|uniref:helix-turn-helix transcriptional regulator n=1 Tax=Clostridium tertium TaxID=1559 RepID=UPI00232CA410|nr:helix-turn-helix transcriptional regulator [Clostridium tertium]MDB1924105.1 helix-turn-helix transcriptional regulator [Clostridium tertium]MDB1927134.1 helix-turn-helix transcriptional regulator [Clostridium tertium]MDB1930911.1 helix-turn-helix transcriptional regulator [Clostridium tertium]
MNKNLAACRRALNISQAEMAEIAGLGLTSYNLKENGKSYFTQKQMLDILMYFKEKGLPVTADELFFNSKVSIMITG